MVDMEILSSFVGWAVSALREVGGNLYQIVAGESLSDFVDIVFLLVVFLLILELTGLLSKWIFLVVNKYKMPNLFEDKIKVIGISMVKRLVTISKISIVAAALFLTIAWIAGIYLKDITIPTVEEFQVKQSQAVTVVSEELKKQPPTECSRSEQLPSAVSKAREALGQMGDFFGGMLNPILAFASFIALLYTIRIQSITQKEAAATVKADRQLSMLIPEYARQVEVMEKLIDTANALLEKKFSLKSDCNISINELIGEAFLIAYSQELKRGENFEIRYSIDDIGERIDTIIPDHADDKLLDIRCYFRQVLEIKVASKNIMKIINRIEGLSGVPLLADMYPSIAKHILKAQLLSRSVKCFNKAGIGVQYTGHLGAHIDSEIKRIARDSYNLIID